jgi:hypothetical protein
MRWLVDSGPLWISAGTSRASGRGDCRDTGHTCCITRALRNRGGRSDTLAISQTHFGIDGLCATLRGLISLCPFRYEPSSKPHGGNIVFAHPSEPDGIPHQMVSGLNQSRSSLSFIRRSQSMVSATSKQGRERGIGWHSSHTVSLRYQLHGWAEAVGGRQAETGRSIAR